MTEAASTDAVRVALDQSACIRSQSNIGETITHNICNGQTAVVPWGGLDWIGFAASGGLALLLFMGIAAIIALIVREFVSW